MKKTAFIAALTVFFLPGVAQSVSRIPLRKVAPAADSVYPAKERQKILSGYLAKAVKEKKNILILAAFSANTRQQDVAFLGKLEKKKIHKVDISSIVSKYIGETEKNLSRLFDKAADNNWTLFFDEADALFGKSAEPSAMMDHIQALVNEKNVRAIFWCEKDCLESLKKAPHVMLE